MYKIVSLYLTEPAMPERLYIYFYLKVRLRNNVFTVTLRIFLFSYSDEIRKHFWNHKYNIYS